MQIFWSLQNLIEFQDNKRRTLQRNDIAMAITKYDQFDFLIDIVPRYCFNFWSDSMICQIQRPFWAIQTSLQPFSTEMISSQQQRGRNQVWGWFPIRSVSWNFVLHSWLDFIIRVPRNKCSGVLLLPTGSAASTAAPAELWLPHPGSTGSVLSIQKYQISVNVQRQL